MRELVIETPLGKHRRKVAQMWDELTPPQYLKACQILLTNWGGMGIFKENEVSVIRQSLLYAITDTDKKFWDGLKAEFVEAYGGDETFLEYLKDVLKLTDFFFKKTEKAGVISYEAHIRRTICPYPTLFFDGQKQIREMTIDAQRQRTTAARKIYERKVRELKEIFGKTKEILWYAPSDGLDNLTFYELCASFDAYERYVKGGQKYSDLDNLLAILYRPSKVWTLQNDQMGYEGDRRIPYRKSEVTVEQRAMKFGIVPILVKQSLLMWFLGCRTMIFENPRFKFLFEGKVSDDPLKLGMFGVLFALQDTPAYNSETAQDENAIFALTYLASKMVKTDE